MKFVRLDVSLRDFLFVCHGLQSSTPAAIPAARRKVSSLREIFLVRRNDWALELAKA